MASISIERVKRSYGTNTVLDGVSLQVADGEFVSLLGPSGCGKSTLLRMIAGLDQPDEGKIFLDSLDITRLAARERDIAMVFQNYALYPHMTAAENIAVPLEQRMLSGIQRLPVIGSLMPQGKAIRTNISDRVRTAAAATSIEHLLDRRPSQLSGGQRQRVALTRAIVRNPKAFLFDEPLSNLDAHLRMQVRDEISVLHKKLGSTFIYVTHDQEEAMSLSNRIALMKNGTILQIATPEELYSRPSSVDVAMFIGQPQMNLLQGRLDDGGRLLIDNVPQPVRFERFNAQECFIGIRPTEIDLVAAVRTAAIKLSVQRRQYVGGANIFHLTTAGGTTVKAVIEAATEVPSQECVFMELRPGTVHFFSSTGARMSDDAIRWNPEHRMTAV